MLEKNITILAAITTTTTTKPKPILLALSCQLCDKTFLVNYTQYRKRKFCSKNCLYKSREIYYICIGCGVGFKPKFRRDPKFCTKECYRKHQKDFCKPKSKYANYYYCDSCEKWIPKNEAKTNVKKHLDYYPTCPNISCNNNRLKIRAIKPQFNHKRIETKRI